MINNIKKYIIFCLVVITIWTLGIPLIFSKLLPIVCENITYNTKYDVHIETPRVKLSLLPTATITTDKLEIKNKNSSEFIIISDLNFKIRLLPLLSGTVHINKVKLDDLNVYVKLDKQLVLDQNFIKSLEESHIKCDRLSINRLNLKAVTNNSSPFIYKASNIYYKKNNRYFNCNLNSELQIDNKKSVINVQLFLPNNDETKSIANIKISKLDISPLKEFLKYYLPDDLNQINGIIDISLNDNHLEALFNNVRIHMKDDAKSIVLPDIFKVSSDFHLTKSKIKIDDAEISSKNIHSFINGYIINYMNLPKANIELKCRIDKSRIEDFISMTPPFVTEDIDSYKLKKYKFFGDIIGNFTIKGNLTEPSVNGDIYISDGVLIKRIPNTLGASIKLNFIGKYLNFDVTVPAGTDEKVWVKGGVELYNVKYSDMHIWSTKNVDLATAESKVIPLHEILNFLIGPVPIMSTQGRGNIDIKVKGNRINPHIWGALNFENVTTHFLDLPHIKMTNANTVINFDDENIFFKLKEGLINNVPADINGTCNVYGKFDFDVLSKNQNIELLFEAINSSPLLNDVKKMLPPINSIRGLCNLKLKIYGNIKDLTKVKYNQNLFSKGNIELLGNSIEYQGITFKSAKGFLNFDGSNASADLHSEIGQSHINMKAIVKENNIDCEITAPKIKLSDILTEIDSSITGIFINFNTKYKGKIEPIECEKIDMYSKILGTSPGNKLKIKNGEFTLKNSKLNIKDFDGFFQDNKSHFSINLSAGNIAENPYFDGTITFKDFELAILNGKFIQYIPYLKDLDKQVKFKKGKINVNAQINHNSINASSNLGGIEFEYVPLNMPLKIINGSIFIRKNNLGLDKINLIADDMPVLLDGNINNIFTKQDFNIYFNCKPQQAFVDKYINNNRIYPIKLKGDIVSSAKIKGTKDDFNVQMFIDMVKNSSLYYLGATIGDFENAIKIELNMDIVKKNLYRIKNFSYDKLISSQNTKLTKMNMLKANGEFEIIPNSIKIKELSIKTSNPTDARIFNIIFRKPNIKQGQFTSNLKIIGDIANPKIIGSFRIFETNIPFLDTTLKNITFIFKDKNIELSANGDILGSNISFRSRLKNRLKSPYYIENATVITEELDLNTITNKLKMSQVDNYGTFESLEGFDLTNFIIKNMLIKADSIKLRNIKADKFMAELSLNEKKELNIKDFDFEMAKGTLSGNFGYNIKNNNINLQLDAKNINANDLTYAIFDLNNQIYGDLTGKMVLSCNGTNFNNCMQTLDGNATFNVYNGRMPKLGSLEYLLKAGNLVKGGITSLSINSVIDIITPLKTGEFSNIYGKIDIKDGIANDIEIATKGKDLSLFITGQYNLATSNADMEVLGLLSKKIATMFGPIGNVSINTLFNVIPGVNLANDSRILEKINKIPGLELNSKAFRKFIAEIKGNINYENYVTSFKWIN